MSLEVANENTYKVARVFTLFDRAFSIGAVMDLTDVGFAETCLILQQLVESGYVAGPISHQTVRSVYKISEVELKSVELSRLVFEYANQLE